MNEREATDAMERALLGEQERVLTDTQTMLMNLASNDLEEAKAHANELRSQANNVEAEGRGVMRLAVLAIRKDFEVPDGTQIVFSEREDGARVGRWTPPPPPPSTLALVKNDEPAAAETGSGTIE